MIKNEKNGITCNEYFCGRMLHIYGDLGFMLHDRLFPPKYENISV